MFRSRRLAFKLTGLALLAFVAQAAFGDGWHISAGPLTRMGMKVDVNGSSFVQSLGINSAAPYDHEPTGIVPGAWKYDLSTYENRKFDDGYVKLDPGTTDPTSIIPGLTWNWGYDNPGQYNPANNTLTYQSSVRISQISQAETLSLSRLTEKDDPVSLSDRMNGFGLGVEVGCDLPPCRSLAVQICGGVKGLWGGKSDFTASTYRERVDKSAYQVQNTRSYDENYVFDATGIIPPTAPYHGTYDGPGPVISNLPISRNRSNVANSRSDTQIGSESWMAANSMTFNAAADVYELWIGMKMGIPVGTDLSLSLTPSVGLNVVDVRADRSESFAAMYADGSTKTLDSWQDSERRTAASFGAGIVAAMEWRISHGWSMDVLGGYDWVSRNVDLAIGPNTVTLDASGFTLGMMLNYWF